MRILFVFPHSLNEMNVYWNKKQDYYFNDNHILIHQFDLINSKVVDEIVSFIYNYNFEKFSEFGIIIHSSNMQIRNDLNEKIKKEQDLKAKLSFVGTYKQGNVDLTEMKGHVLDNACNKKPLDKTRNGIINNNNLLFEEGFNELWAFFLTNQVHKDILDAKLNLLHTCLINTPNDNPIEEKYSQTFQDYKEIVPKEFDRENSDHIEALRTFRDKLLTEHK
jgi:hypothetical protein